MKVILYDRVGYTSTLSKREYTDEGFLRVPGRVARTGIQEYFASELGLKDRAPNDIIKVMRPPEEVFNAQSLDTYSGADVTVGHPSKMVDAESFKKVSAGVSHSAASQDGDFVIANLIIKDKSAIKAIEDGTVELSAGYSAIYDDNVPEGAEYEFIQRDIKINHIALVDRARAGAQARLYDQSPLKDKPMKVITLDGSLTVEVEDDDKATLISGAFDRLTAQLKAAEDQASEHKKTADAMSAKADKSEEDIEEERKKSSEDAILARVSDIAKVKDSAVKIAGAEFTCDSLVVLDIQKAALKSVRDSVKWDDQTETYIQVAFDMQLEQAVRDDKNKVIVIDQYKKLSADGHDANKQPANPRQDAMDGKTEAWKKTANGGVE